MADQALKFRKISYTEITNWSIGTWSPISPENFNLMFDLRCVYDAMLQKATDKEMQAPYVTEDRREVQVDDQFNSLFLIAEGPSTKAAD